MLCTALYVLRIHIPSAALNGPISCSQTLPFPPPFPCRSWKSCQSCRFEKCVRDAGMLRARVGKGGLDIGKDEAKEARKKKANRAEAAERRPVNLFRDDPTGEGPSRSSRRSEVALYRAPAEDSLSTEEQVGTVCLPQDYFCRHLPAQIEIHERTTVLKDHLCIICKIH